MAIDLEALSRITSAGHPDTAHVAMPVSMLREIETVLRRANADALTSDVGLRTVAIATDALLGRAA